MNRVKITYAVDLEEVPIVANSLYEDACTQVSELVEDMSEANFHKDELSALSEKVHQFRTTLARIDQRLDDCLAIVSGYYATLYGNPNTEQEHPVPPDGVDDLSEKISALQRAMQGTGDDGQ